MSLHSLDITSQAVTLILNPHQIPPNFSPENDSTACPPTHHPHSPLNVQQHLVLNEISQQLNHTNQWGVLQHDPEPNTLGCNQDNISGDKTIPPPLNWHDISSSSSSSATNIVIEQSLALQLEEPVQQHPQLPPVHYSIIRQESNG
eukprot:5235612-Ditylum_brightwellii.AAC.1